MIEALFAQIDLPAWWEICKVAGAGAAVVLGPVAYLLWKSKETDSAYIREADKNTLKVLWELTSLLQTDGKEGKERQKELLDAIRDSQESIKAHFDDRYKPH